jgi:hypothetical protein
MSITWKCYVLPIVGVSIFYLLSIPKVSEVFSDWIPDTFNSIVSKGLILLVVLFLVSCGLYSD